MTGLRRHLRRLERRAVMESYANWLLDEGASVIAFRQSKAKRLAAPQLAVPRVGA